MFELTNEQRKCFALTPVSDNWECIEVKPSPYDKFRTYAYIDNDTIVKCIISGDAEYTEYELCERISSDKKFLLPKTEKGKPVPLSSSNLLKRNGTGMALKFSEDHKYICLRSALNQCDYYSNNYVNDDVYDLDDFSEWVEKWCNETTDTDLSELLAFSQKKRQNIRYNEGDVFRFKIDRRLYGYGRILLDFSKMRKRKEPFWDILMAKPIVCSVYHIVTERHDVSVDELRKLPSLPSTIIADNSLYYGEYEIIGNLPITEDEDYPVMYGNSISVGDNAVCYQHGKTYRRIENGKALYPYFKNNRTSFLLNFTLDILLQCIKEKSNKPYWSIYSPWSTEYDLRNPKHVDKLKRIRAQFGL